MAGDRLGRSLYTWAGISRRKGYSAIDSSLFRILAKLGGRQPGHSGERSTKIGR